MKRVRGLNSVDRNVFLSSGLEIEVLRALAPWTTGPGHPEDLANLLLHEILRREYPRQ